jgi:hypothetical protein
LITFFKTFGQTFNYIATGISTRGDGRLFSKVDTKQVNWAHPFSFAIENPQSPGSFLGENAFQSMTFRARCGEVYSALMGLGDRPPQSLLLRVIKAPDAIIRTRNALKKQYQRLVAIAVESFSLDADNDRPRSGRNESRREQDESSREQDESPRDRNERRRDRDESPRDRNEPPREQDERRRDRNERRRDRDEPRREPLDWRGFVSRNRAAGRSPPERPPFHRSLSHSGN